MTYKERIELLTYIPSLKQRVISNEPKERTAIPDKVNWVTQGKVDHVRNGGSMCSTSWAQVVSDTIASGYAIKHNSAYISLSG